MIRDIADAEPALILFRYELDKIALEHVPEKCGRFSDKDMFKLKGIEHFR